MNAERRPGGRRHAVGETGTSVPHSVPILPAYRSGSALYVWCEHEHRWHYHGGGAGHRVAHCLCERSPHRTTGYVLREAGRFTAEVRRAHGRPLRVCGTCRGPREPDDGVTLAGFSRKRRPAVNRRG